MWVSNPTSDRMSQLSLVSNPTSHLEYLNYPGFLTSHVIEYLNYPGSLTSHVIGYLNYPWFLTLHMIGCLNYPGFLTSHEIWYYNYPAWVSYLACDWLSPISYHQLSFFILCNFLGVLCCLCWFIEINRLKHILQLHMPLPPYTSCIAADLFDIKFVLVIRCSPSDFHVLQDVLLMALI